eukprot:scaffold97269_cov35-Phaeocystis_antarctica.AAC.2
MQVDQAAQHATEHSTCRVLLERLLELLHQLERRALARLHDEPGRLEQRGHEAAVEADDRGVVARGAEQRDLPAQLVQPRVALARAPLRLQRQHLDGHHLAALLLRR